MARVVVAGSIAVDEVVRLAQPLLSGAHLDGRAAGRRLGGGAANTGRPLAYAGHQVTLVAPVGTDADGDWLMATLASDGIDTSAIVRLPGPGTRSLVLLDPDGERTVVNLHRCVEPGPPSRLLALPADVLYVRSRETSLAPLLLPRLGTALVVAHVPPAGPLARPAHVLVASASDLSPADRDAPWEMGRRVSGEALRWVVVTRGAAGAQAIGADRRFSIRARAVSVVDTTGAGDVFAAGLIHALSAGKRMEEALATAVAWGSAAVASEGLPSREEIQRLT